jgi:hypothetical protein
MPGLRIESAGGLAGRAATPSQWRVLAFARLLHISDGAVASLSRSLLPAPFISGFQRAVEWPQDEPRGPPLDTALFFAPIRASMRSTLPYAAFAALVPLVRGAL